MIGDSANAASIGLHAACGFRHAGLLQGVGFKFGRWVDSVLMQKEPGEGIRSAPAALSTPGGDWRFGQDLSDFALRPRPISCGISST